VVAHNPVFFRRLQAASVELALHGYDHVDFRGLNRDEAARQIALAQQAFHRAGIRFEGIRCPYLSSTPELHQSLPSDLRYTSNGSVWWEKLHSGQFRNGRRAEFETLPRFYTPKFSSSNVAVPRFVDGKLDIPVSLPDDLQLCDGLRLTREELARTWLEVLNRTHRRGEVFVLLFHPELYAECASTFSALLKHCEDLRPRVWTAQLREISQWWWEKSNFTAEVDRLRIIRFHASERATILVRGIEGTATTAWAGRYRVLECRELQIGQGPLPFVALSSSANPAVESFLEQQGYIVRRGVGPSVCSLYLGEKVLTTLHEVDLIDYIESSSAPLVRFWRWPNRCKSAVAITGDLDALSLRDYASRIFAA
jgi:peptidoglycan/xylan/chitin deacetylase (PgdA/CDA1 family)